MHRRDQLLRTEQLRRADGSESDQRLDNSPDDGLVDVLHEVVDHLFAAGLDVQMALDRVDHGTESALWMHSVAVRLDTAITTILRAGLTVAADASGRDPTRVDTFDALACGLTEGIDLADHLRTIIDPAVVAAAERMLAERHHIAIAEAVTALSTYAHRHDQRLPDVARAVIDGTLDLSNSVADLRCLS